MGLGHHQGVQAARLVHGAGHGGVAAPAVHLQLRGAAAPGTVLADELRPDLRPHARPALAAQQQSRHQVAHHGAAGGASAGVAQ